MARVMVVEDDDVVRSLVEARLVAAEHWVRVAASVPEARALLQRTGPPDVVVSDMFMPGGSGLQLVEELRADPDLADLPVVFLSGRALPGDVDAGRSLGAAYLGKPVSTAELLGAVDDAVVSGPARLRASVHRALGATDPQAASRALAGLVAQAPAVVDAVRAAVEADDGDALLAVVQELGERAGALGIDPVARLATDLADRVHAGDLPEPAAVVAVVEQTLARTCRTLAVLADEHAAVRAG